MVLANIIHELKEKIDAVVEKKLPSFKALMEMNPMAVARTTVNDASLTVYQNGYAVYEMDGAHTVMAVERCGDYRYDFTDDTYQVVPAETFEETEWSVRLLMEGERRMEHNRNNRTAETENVSLECDGSDWSAAVMVDFLDEDNAEMLADQELRRLYAAIAEQTGMPVEQVMDYCRELGLPEIGSCHLVPPGRVKERRCPVCGRIIGQSGRGAPRKYCSDECYAEYERRNYKREKAGRVAFCQNCGRPFTAICESRSQRMFCSRNCYFEFRYGMKEAKEHE